MTIIPNYMIDYVNGATLARVNVHNHNVNKVLSHHTEPDIYRDDSLVRQTNIQIRWTFTEVTP